MNKRPDDEREQTDHALRTERDETDEKLLEARSKLEDEADTKLCRG